MYNHSKKVSYSLKYQAQECAEESNQRGKMQRIPFNECVTLNSSVWAFWKKECANNTEWIYPKLLECKVFARTQTEDKIDDRTNDGTELTNKYSKESKWKKRMQWSTQEWAIEWQSKYLLGKSMMQRCELLLRGTPANWLCSYSSCSPSKSSRIPWKTKFDCSFRWNMLQMLRFFLSPTSVTMHARMAATEFGSSMCYNVCTEFSIGKVHIVICLVLQGIVCALCSGTNGNTQFPGMLCIVFSFLTCLQSHFSPSSTRHNLIRHTILFCRCPKTVQHTHIEMVLSSAFLVKM